MHDFDRTDDANEDFQTTALVHMDALFNSAVRMTGNVADAEDLVQETFLKAFRFFARFRKDSNCLAWLFKIMKNSYINRFRQKSREPATVSIDAGLPGQEGTFLETPGHEMEPADSMYSRILDDEVEDAVRSLPEEFKLVVLLSDVEGMQYREIADVLGCPVGTVRSRLSRGRSHLRKHLQSYARELGYLEKDTGR
ncbi:MAG: sigma-70 family RNA polymerase sigma factor [Candidatus Latescibacteria bacterium]|nr:sigma-70 family RNA polymerase sigma factor [Candidatus Latescibacterota bacterium]